VKKFFLVIFLLIPVCLWAQERLILPVVPPEEVMPVARPEFSPSPPLVLPQAESQILEIGTHQFGGLNLFVPTNRVPKEQAIQCRNLIPEGMSALRMRDGYEKINFTAIDGVYGATIAQGTIPQILIGCADSLRYADSTTTWEFDAIDTTEDVLTYFASTPFGVVVLNGTDSARIWDGSSIEALGVVDTGTFDADSTVGGDTSWVADSSAAWTADEWVGYWLKCSGSYLEIIDNGNNWFHVKLCGDTCDADTAFLLLARPDSVGATLGYPIGVAGTYYQDRFFISSEWRENRVYFSEVRDPDNIAPENFINLDMDAHDEIVAMRVFNGYLIVFGKYSIYGINASRVATPITKSLGCDVPYTIALGDEYIYFKSADGVYRFKPNIYGSMSYKPEKISGLVDDIIDNIDPQNLDYCGGVYVNGQYWFSYHPDSCIVFDERIQQWYGPQTFGFTPVINYNTVFGKTWNEILFPSANGDTIEWTPSTGSNYACIDDIEDYSDYVSVSTANKKDFFEFTNTAQVATGSKSKLRLYVSARKDPSLYVDLDVYLVANQQRYLLEHFERFTRHPSTKYSLEEINPITDSAWTKGDLDSLKLAIVSYGNTLVFSLWVTVEGQGDLGLNSFLFGSPNKSHVYKYGGIVTDDTTQSGASVYGKHITATYQPGFFDNDLPTDDKLLRQFYLQTESDSGDIWIYYYTDYGTTPSDSDLVHLGDKRTSWWMLGEKVKGKNFSIKVENKSNVDSLIIKGWWAKLNNLGHRGGE